jgi:hypothetical protein
MHSERIKKYWRILSPGLIKGASKDDPWGIAAYSQVSAGYDCHYYSNL